MNENVDRTLKDDPNDNTLMKEHDARKQKAHRKAPTLKELKDAPTLKELKDAPRLQDE